MDKTIQTISLLGAGWLGTPLGRALHEDGYTVKGSTTRVERFPELKQNGIMPFQLYIEGEQMRAESPVDDFFQCDLLILNLPPGRRQPDVETEYPKRIKSVSMLAQQYEIPYCLFASSTSVYPNTNNVVVENDAETPSTASGKALLTAERYLGLITQPQTTILRLGGLVGGNRQPGRFLAGKKELKNGQAPVNLVHQDDCIRICQEIIRQHKWGETYNVVADDHPLRQSFYPEQARKLGLVPPTFKNDPQPSFKVVSNHKVKEDLGYDFIWPDPMAFP